MEQGDSWTPTQHCAKPGDAPTLPGPLWLHTSCSRPRLLEALTAVSPLASFSVFTVCPSLTA